MTSFDHVHKRGALEIFKFSNFRTIVIKFSYKFERTTKQRVLNRAYKRHLSLPRHKSDRPPSLEKIQDILKVNKFSKNTQVDAPDSMPASIMEPFSCLT